MTDQSSVSQSLSLSATWRQAALAGAAEVEAVADAVEDYAPEQATYVAADAAVRVVLEHLRGVLTENEYGRTEAYEDAVEQVNAMLEEAKSR